MWLDRFQSQSSCAIWRVIVSFVQIWQKNFKRKCPRLPITNSELLWYLMAKSWIRTWVCTDLVAYVRRMGEGGVEGVKEGTRVATPISRPKFLHLQWRIQDFCRGVPSPTGRRRWLNFIKNVPKLKKLTPMGGVLGAPQIRKWFWYSPQEKSAKTIRG